MNRLSPIHNVIDLMLFSGNKNSKSNAMPARNHTEYTKHIEQIVTFMNILYDNHLLNTFVIRSESLNELIIETYVTKLLIYFGILKTNNRKILFDIKLEDISNALLYMYIYVIAPVLYRVKSNPVVTGEVGGYVSFQFPECIPVARKYFVRNEESTIKGMVFLKNVFIRLDVTKILDGIKKLLLWWNVFTNKKYIEIPLKRYNNKPKTKTDCKRKLINPATMIYGHFDNNYTFKSTNKNALHIFPDNDPIYNHVANIKRVRNIPGKVFRTVRSESFEKALPILLNELILGDTFRALNVQIKVKVERNMLLIPNIYNRNLTNYKDKNRYNISREARFRGIIWWINNALLLGGFFIPECLLKPTVYFNSFNTVIQDIKKWSYKYVGESRFISPEQFLRENFGIKFKTQNNKLNITTAENGKIHLPMVLLYIKLISSLLKVDKNKRNKRNIEKPTNVMCSFYHRFEFNKRNSTNGAKETKQLIAYLSKFFDIFNYSYTVELPSNVSSNVWNEANLKRIVKQNEDKSEFISLVSVYVSLINMLKIIHNKDVTFESGFLEASGKKRTSVQLIKMDDKNNTVLKYIKDYIVVKHLDKIPIQVKRQYRNRLHSYILKEFFKIPVPLLGLLARTTRATINNPITRPVTRLSKKALPLVKNGIKRVKKHGTLIKFASPFVIQRLKSRKKQTPKKLNIKKPYGILNWKN